MWLARMVCSGLDCSEEIEAIVTELDELDRFGCPCARTLVVMAISEVELVRP